MRWHAQLRCHGSTFWNGFHLGEAVSGSSPMATWNAIPVRLTVGIRASSRLWQGLIHSSCGKWIHPVPTYTELIAFPVSIRECSGKATPGITKFVKTSDHAHTVAAEGQNPAVEA